MIIYEPVLPEDILSMDLANLDSKSENFTFQYYINYFANSAPDFFSARAYDNSCLAKTDLIYTNPILGYIFGGQELKEKPCLHLSALSVSPQYRKHKIGSSLMRTFEANGNSYGAWFIDLFVRESNKIAISFYTKLGYSVYRKVFCYYSNPLETAFDMRMSLKNDVNKECQKAGEDFDCISV